MRDPCILVHCFRPGGRNLRHEHGTPQAGRDGLSSTGRTQGATMGSAALGEAIKGITAWAMNDSRHLDAPVSVGEVFGALTFSDRMQQARLPKAVYRSLRDTISRGKPLDISTADAVATALKDWAMEHGASHFTHWFQPMTGITAEKHDSFYGPTRRRPGAGGVQRQGAGEGRARRVELPVGRHAQHLRGARLHGVGPDQPAVAADERQQRNAGDPDGVCQLDRRGARQEDAAAAIDGGAVGAGGAGAQAVRIDRRRGSPPPAAPNRSTS